MHTEELGWLNNPVFILGYPKSGTSLLNAILDSHPELVVIPEEVDFFTSIYPSLLSFGGKTIGNEHIQMFLHLLRKSSHVRNMSRSQSYTDISGNADYSGFDYEAFENIISTYLLGKKFHWRNFYISIPYAYYQVTRSAGINYAKISAWVEKTPTNVYFTKLLLRTFPEGKHIQIIRDPRDNYLAYAKKIGLDPLRFCYSWRRYENSINSDSFDRAKKMRYEDLTTEPVAELKELSSFLGIEYTDVMLKPSKAGVQWEGNSMYSVKHDGITRKSQGQFKQKLDKEVIALIESLCKEGMRRNSYPEYVGSNDSLSHFWNSAVGGVQQIKVLSRYIYMPILKAKIKRLLGNFTRRTP